MKWRRNISGAGSGAKTQVELDLGLKLRWSWSWFHGLCPRVLTPGSEDLGTFQGCEIRS